MDKTPYRTAEVRPEAAEEPSLPPWVDALARLTFALLTLLGPAASVALATAHFFWIPPAVVHCCAIVFVLGLKASGEIDAEWRTTIIVAAWAPVALPAIGLWRLGRWIVKGA